MLDDPEPLHGPGSVPVYDGVGPQRRPVRPRPGRRVAETTSREQGPEGVKDQAPAGQRPAEPPPPRTEPLRQAAAKPGSQPAEPARPMSRVERLRAARAARAAEEAKAAERARAAEKAKARALLEQTADAGVRGTPTRAAAEARGKPEQAAAQPRRTGQDTQARTTRTRPKEAAGNGRSEPPRSASAPRSVSQAARTTRRQGQPAARTPEQTQDSPTATRTVPGSRSGTAARVPASEAQGQRPVREAQGQRPASETRDPVPAPVPGRSGRARAQAQGQRQARGPQGSHRQASRQEAGDTAEALSRTLPLSAVPGLKDALEAEPATAQRKPAKARREPGSRLSASARAWPGRHKATASGSHRAGKDRRPLAWSRSAWTRAAGTLRSRRAARVLTPLRARGRVLTMAAAAGVGLLWLLAAVLTSSTVSARTVCSGVPIGGLSPEEAAQAVETALAEQVNGPLLVSADGGTAQLSGSAVKAKVDGAQSIRGLTGFTLDPQVLFRRVRGGQEVKAVVTADPEAVRAELSSHLDQLSHGAVSAQVSLVDGQVRRTAASAGTGVDLDSATDMLAAAWPVGAQEAIALPEGVTEPAVTDAEASAFVTNVLEPLVSGPVTLTVAGTEVEGRAARQTHELSAEDLAGLAAVKEEGGALTVTLDPGRLREQVLEGFGSGIETQASGYKWTIDGSETGAPSAKPQLAAATPGQVVDGEKLSKTIVEGVSKSGPSAATRTVTLALAEAAADTSGEAQAQALGIKEVIGSSDTPFESDPQRDQNLRTGTAAVNGTLIMPGQSYSMAQTIGPVEPERGYAEAGVIMGSKHVNGLGGGLSQVTTTVFNAAYAAGMEDDEHTPHSQYMSRYPAGLEATLWSGQIDMRFTNTTPYAVLLQAWVGEGQVHVRAWSTHYYDVEVSTSDRFNVVQQGHTHSTDADCFPNPEGQPGFDITVTRRRSLNGAALPEEVRTVHYEPNSSVSCG